MAQVTGLQNSGSFTLGSELGGIMSEHRFDGSVSMSGDLRTERILFPKSAPGNPDSHSIGFPFTTTNPSDDQVFTDLTVEAQGGFGGSVNYTGGTLRLLCGRGKNASMHGNVYIGSTADRMANAPSPLTVNGDISGSGDVLIPNGAIVANTIDISTGFVANSSGGTGAFQVKGVNDDHMIVGNTQSDLVGIGTLIPKAKLHVTGDISGSGDIHGVTGSFSHTRFPGGMLAFMEQNGQGTTSMSYLATTSWGFIRDTFAIGGVGTFAYEAKCGYILPASGTALIRFRVYVDQPGHTAPILYFRVCNAGGTSLGSKYERKVIKVDESDDKIVEMEWVIPNSDWSMIAGQDADLRIEVKCSTAINAPTLYWGGSSSDSYPSMTIEVTEMPVVIQSGKSPV